jgi:hypothetical protein
MLKRQPNVQSVPCHPRVLVANQINSINDGAFYRIRHICWRQKKAGLRRLFPALGKVIAATVPSASGLII